MRESRVRLMFRSIGFLASVAFSIWCAHAAPPERVARVGFVGSQVPGTWSMVETAITDGLRDHGYVEGKNLMLVKRRVDFPNGSMTETIADLLAMDLDVLIAGCGWSTSTAIRATRAPKATPIVMISASDPVSRGWIQSFARPGANVTGVSGISAEVPIKMLDHLRLALPEVKSIGIPFNPLVAANQQTLRRLEVVASRLKIKLTPIDLTPLTSTELMRRALLDSGVQAVMMIPDDDLFWKSLDRILAASDSLRIPTAFFRSDFLESGGLLSYGAKPPWLFRRAGFYVDKIVNGANPAALPVELPTQFEYAINLRRAAELGITFPRSVLLRADTLVK